MEINEVVALVQSVPPADRFTDEAILAFASYPDDDGAEPALFSLLVRVAESYARQVAGEVHERRRVAEMMLVGLAENLADEFDLPLPVRL